MHILLLTPQLPYPPHQGTAMRNYGLIAGLAYQHRVTLVSLLAPGDDLARAGPLYEVCEGVYAAAQPLRTASDRFRALATSRLPDMAHRLASSEFAALVDRVLQELQPDVVQFEGIEMAPYLRVPLGLRQAGMRIPLLVLDDHNAEYLLQRRVFETDVRSPSRWLAALYSLLQWRRLWRYEAWACRQVDVVAAVSEPDARALRRIVPGLQPVVVPNGIDYQTYAAYEPAPGFLPPQSLVFTGKMDYRPNVDAALWFAQRVLPLVRAAAPQVRFYIVGQRPHRRLDALRKEAGVVITGRVPETQPYIASAALYVIPLRSGGGTRFKVLEAMAMGQAVVSTSMGCDGFPVAAGREVDLADDPQAFATAVLELLSDPERRRAMGAMGQRFAARYDWSEIVPLMVEGYRTAKPRVDS
ncbi:MAG: glycosyltransferase [Anaerolineae bacterium]|nr:glycosyltransferase [Anaerolineae bacterium]